MSDLELVDFNINDYVWVRLTQTGKLIHRRRYDELRREVPSLPKYRAPLPDAAGYTRWQMWELMQTFGPHISMAADPPFHLDIKFEARVNA